MTVHAPVSFQPILHVPCVLVHSIMPKWPRLRPFFTNIPKSHLLLIKEIEEKRRRRVCFGSINVISTILKLTSNLYYVYDVYGVCYLSLSACPISSLVAGTLALCIRCFVLVLNQGSFSMIKAGRKCKISLECGQKLCQKCEFFATFQIFL